MERKKIIYFEEPKKKVGRKSRYFGKHSSKTYYANPYLIERYGGKIFLPEPELKKFKLDPKFNLPAIIRESSPDENVVIRGIANTYKKFDVLTIFIHLQTLTAKATEFLRIANKTAVGKKSSPFIEFEKLRAYLKDFPGNPIKLLELRAKNYTNLINLVIHDERVQVQKPKRHRSPRHP